MEKLHGSATRHVDLSRLAHTVLPTAVVGSYPQPDWLIDRSGFSRAVPRIRRADLWRVDPEFLQDAQDDATILAIRSMERAGVDVVSDGEIRRESYSNHFTTALDGVDSDNPAEIASPSGKITSVPRIVGKITRNHPVQVRDMEFLRSKTTHTAMMTIPGPFTISRQLHNEYYADEEELIMDLAAAVNTEVHDLVAAGADVISLDEPWVRQDPEASERFAVPAIDRALEGIDVETVVHVCFGYAAVNPGKAKPSGYSFLGRLSECSADTISIEAAQPKLDLGVLQELTSKQIMLGVIDLADEQVESPEVVAQRIRAALEYTTADKLIPAPDCGMKYLPRDRAFGKLKALADGAAIVRQELMRAEF